jgi:serine protease Do
LAVGEQVVAIGDPFLLGQRDHIPTVTLGIVSAIGMNGPNAGDVVVTDAPINPGNSGGPLVNLAGQLVGINYAQMPNRFGIRINNGSGYAISSNQVRRFLDALKNAKGGQVSIAWLNGAKFEDQPDDQAIVRAVEPTSAAGRAGLEAGDHVLSVGPWPVLSVTQLFMLTARSPAGTPSTLLIQRGLAKRELTVTLERPERVGLGVVFESASAATMKIERVLPGSPAYQAGLRSGDIIRGVAGLALPNRKAMADLLLRGRTGQKVAVTISRGPQQMNLLVELAGESELARLLKQATPKPDATPATTPTDHRRPTTAPEA